LRLELSRTLAALVAAGALDPVTRPWQAAHLSYWREWLLSALTQDSPSPQASIADSDVHDTGATEAAVLGNANSNNSSSSTNNNNTSGHRKANSQTVTHHPTANAETLQEEEGRLPQEAIRSETCRALAALAALPGLPGMQVGWGEVGNALFVGD
jgi:hypothetical protein